MSNSHPTIYIRVDGNETIATGHVMRCLSIAVQLKKRGCDVVFLTADSKPAELIQSRGFSIDVLHTIWNQMDDETKILCRYLNNHNASILMIDSYQVTSGYLSSLSRIVKVIYIDDLKRFAYPVHTIINYSVWAREQDYIGIYQNAESLLPDSNVTISTPASSTSSNMNPLPRFLIGGNYIPLREEFAHVKRTVNPDVKNILITMGGTDSYNVIGKLLHRIFDQTTSEDTASRQDHSKSGQYSNHPVNSHISKNNLPAEKCDFQSKDIETLPSMEYHVIVGIFNQNKEELYALAKQYPNIHLYENISNMSDYMRKCDIAISAGGSTLYELCACGTPTIVMEIADNQNGAKTWQDHDYMLYAGNIVKNEETCLAACLSHLNTYINNYQLRRSFSERMQSLVDGKGAERIAEYLRQL